MKRYSPWVFFNKSAKISESNLELNTWKNAFSRYVTTYIIDEDKGKFDNDNIESSISNILRYSGVDTPSFLCSLHFGESLFPKESFNFLRNYGLKRILVLTSEGVTEGIYQEISLGFFDFILIDSVSEHFGMKSIIHDINPFMEVRVYDNLKVNVTTDQEHEWKIIVDKTDSNDVVLKNQIKNMSALGMNGSLDSVSEIDISKPINGWIVLPQMADRIMTMKKAVVLNESGERVFVPTEVYNNINCCIAYNSLQDIKNWSINERREMNKTFKCSDISDFGIKMLSIIHGS